ncbi:BT_2262 family domain-containing protein [Saccharicrinis fermentans]|uniref:Pesticidal crystal protein Cry22Aa Ig-like domain-containing protein n=1 Tax=Saccharicrinis fermentans DSM 9555 = JCM 21142 TaxID=869213 RepID=W7Y9T1_9BACT|nr:BT_2262 family domain-containing protein [Saccharicrinis fermentans]GAF05067.1 hypothetical protein JCM21142_93790 [Saccharicrinis fermentans DSM 9555 = JCM 21142]
MKDKLILKIFIITLISLISLSCDDDSTGGETGLTVYPTLDLIGESSVIIEKGVDFEDPGYTSFLSGEDVSDEVIVTSNVDVNVPGVYLVTYEITNSDGYPVSKSRTVYVADTTPSVISTSMHSVLTDTHRINHDSDDARTDFAGYEVLFLQTEPGVFYCSDLLGGYYDQRAGYGSGYAMNGYFKLNEDNTISLISSSVPSWGDSADGMRNGFYDPSTGNIAWTIDYAGILEFNIIFD